MSASVPVRIVSSAARAIAEAAEWWAANRPKAPDAFVVELERALQLIASQPARRARNKRKARRRATRSSCSGTLSSLLPRHLRTGNRSPRALAYEPGHVS